MNKIETIVRNYIVRHGMWKHDGSYIVALSGGADSVALLLILKNLGMPIHAAHCNFHLRGEESERDEQFCVDLCEREGICLHRIHFDTLTYAEKHKVSIEMAARDLRYRYFAQLARDIEADGICVAHHRDDNVETLLLNLLRGSGVDGLAAIAPKNGNILRPLLCISRQDILDYLAEKGQDYVTDSTNLEDDALRNKIRHHVIPLLETLNPAARENIAQSARYLRQAKMMLDDAVGVPSQPEDSSTSQPDDSSNTITIGKQLVMQAASPEFMLHQLIGSYGFHGDTIDGIIESMNSQDGGIGNQVSFPLTYRLTQQGDRFKPFGMKGTKLVSDYLTDRKRNYMEKMSQHVLTDKTGEIIWLIGERTSDHCRITPDTPSILEIELEENSEV